MSTTCFCLIIVNTYILQKLLLTILKKYLYLSFKTNSNLQMLIKIKVKITILYLLI